MGVQRGMYIADADVETILEWADELGLGVLEMWPRTLEPTPAAAFRFGEVEWKIFFVPMALASEVETDPEVSSHGTRIIRDERSPVIEWVRSRRMGEQLWPGRFYLSTKRDAPTYKEIHRIYQALTRKLKSWDEAADGRHVGPAAAKLAAASEIRLGEGNTNAWRAPPKRAAPGEDER